VMVVPRRPRLPVKVIETLIVWFVELSVVSFGSVVLPAVFDRHSPDIVLWGLATAIMFIAGAIALAWRLGK